MKKLTCYFYITAIFAVMNFLFSFSGFLLAVLSSNKKLIVLGNLVFWTMGVTFFSFSLIAIVIKAKELEPTPSKKLSKKEEMVKFLLEK